MASSGNVVIANYNNENIVFSGQVPYALLGVAGIMGAIFVLVVGVAATRHVPFFDTSADWEAGGEPLSCILP